MSITLIAGRPGDGKSYSAVHLSILPALKQGRSLFTNIELNIPLLKLELGLSDDQYLKYIPKETLKTTDLQDIPGGCLIVLDEVWRYWKSEERNPSTEDEKFFAEHRHKVGRMPQIDGMLSQDIVLITQNIMEVPRWIRGRIASTYKIEKLTAAGFQNKFRVDIHRGCNPRFPKDGYISSSISDYSSDVWRYYKSHTAAQETGGVDTATIEKGAVRNVSVWRSQRMLTYYVIFGIALLFLLWSFNNSQGAIFGNPDPNKYKVTSDTPIPNPASLSAVPTSMAYIPSVENNLTPTPEIIAQPINPDENIKSLTHWISGYYYAYGFYTLILTNGNHNFRIKISEDQCTQNPLTCNHDKTQYNTIPITNKTIMPDSIHQIAGIAQPPRHEAAGAMPQN